MALVRATCFAGPTRSVREWCRAMDLDVLLLLHEFELFNLMFDLRETGYAPDRTDFPPAGWEYRREKVAYQRALAAEQARIEALRNPPGQTEQTFSEGPSIRGGYSRSSRHRPKSKHGNLTRPRNNSPESFSASRPAQLAFATPTTTSAIITIAVPVTMSAWSFRMRPITPRSLTSSSRWSICMNRG